MSGLLLPQNFDVVYEADLAQCHCLFSRCMALSLKDNLNVVTVFFFFFFFFFFCCCFFCFVFFLLSYNRIIYEGQREH